MILFVLTFVLFIDINILNSKIKNMKTKLVLIIIVSIVIVFVILPFIYRIVKTYYQRKKEQSYPVHTNGYLWNKAKEDMLSGTIKCRYCGKKFTVKKSTPLHEVSNLYVQNIANDYFHKSCFDEFQYD